MNALRQIEIDHFHTVAFHEFPCAGKSPALAHDHFGDLELYNGAGAHVTWHQGGIDHGVPVAANAPGIVQAIHFTMQDGVVVLHSPVVTTGDELAFAHKYGSDRNATFALSHQSFLNCCLHEFIHDANVHKMPIGAQHFCAITFAAIDGNMPSVDILSKVDVQTLDNAINTVKRELETRYDLRGSNSNVEFDKKALTIKVSTEDHLKMDSIIDILLERSTKQKVDVRSYDLSDEPTPSGKLVYRTIKVKQGIERETAKKIVKVIKDSGLKVQPQIMDDLIRVNGKKIDDLQQVMALCREKDFEIPLQFDNMKS